MQKVDAGQLQHISWNGAAHLFNDIIDKLEAVERKVINASDARDALTSLNQSCSVLSSEVSRAVAAEAALIQSLIELVPGFETRFSQLCSRAQTSLANTHNASLEEILSVLRKDQD